MGLSGAPTLPRWRSHKEVYAAKVTGVSEGTGDVAFVWHLDGGSKIDVDKSLAARVPSTQKVVGGYIVVYDDGFRSWSPAQAFEEGYTRIV